MANRGKSSVHTGARRRRVYVTPDGKSVRWKASGNRNPTKAQHDRVVVPWAKRKGYTRPRWVLLYPTATHYSPHFTKREMHCKCGCTPSAAVKRELRRLALALEALKREIGGRPVILLSVHRCRAENTRVKGASDSRHLYGMAADFNVPAMAASGTSRERLKRAIVKIPALNGLGNYPNGGLHGDTRPAPLVEWNSW